jgi:hypothetical protein
LPAAHLLTFAALIFRSDDMLHCTSADGTAWHFCRQCCMALLLMVLHCISDDGVALQEDERILRKLLSKVRKSADQVSAGPGVIGWMHGQVGKLAGARDVAGLPCWVMSLREREGARKRQPASKQAGRQTGLAKWLPLAKRCRAAPASPLPTNCPCCCALCALRAARRARCGGRH